MPSRICHKWPAECELWHDGGAGGKTAGRGKLEAFLFSVSKKATRSCPIVEEWKQQNSVTWDAAT